jgi:hypothetical protein
MHNSWMTVTALAALFVWSMVCAGCTPNPSTDIQSLKVPAGFDYSTTQEVTVTATVSDVAGNPRSGTEVIVGGTGGALVPGNIYGRGITNDLGKFQQVISIPARLSTLRLQASALGIANTADAAITKKTVSVAFGPES